MAIDYTPTTLSEFKKQTYSINNTYLLKGIPRAIKFIFGVGSKYGYAMEFYLQNETDLVGVQCGSTNDMLHTDKEQLLRAASESNLEIIVKGKIKTTSLKYPMLEMDEAIIDGRVIKSKIE